MQILVINDDISRVTSTTSCWTSSPIDTSIDVSWGPYLETSYPFPEVIDLCSDLYVLAASVYPAPKSAHMLTANYKEPALARLRRAIMPMPRAPPGEPLQILLHATGINLYNNHTRDSQKRKSMHDKLYGALGFYALVTIIVMVRVLKSSDVSWWELLVKVLWPISIPLFALTLPFDAGVRFHLWLFDKLGDEILRVKNGECPAGAVVLVNGTRMCSNWWHCSECVEWYEKLPLYKKIQFSIEDSLQNLWKKVWY